MDKNSNVGKLIGGAFNWGKKAIKNYWPVAVPYALNAAMNYGQGSEAQAEQGPQAGGRSAIAGISGATNVSRIRDLMPKTGGDNPMASRLSILDRYTEQQRAFEWGVEQFCKQAGFDAEDTKAMLELVKEAGLPGAMARSRGIKPMRGGAGRPSPFTNLELQPVPKSTYTPQVQSAPGAATASVSQRLRDSMMRKRQRANLAAGVGGVESQPQMQASGGPKPDGSWLPWAALLGGGYLAHGYGTEGGTYSMFDPEEVREAKRQNRNKAVGVASPQAKTQGSEATKNPVSFEDDVAARNRTTMENYLKQLQLTGPDDPRSVAAGFYGDATQPSNLNNFNYFMEQQPEYQARLTKMFGADKANEIMAKMRAKTTGQTGSF